MSDEFFSEEELEKFRSAGKIAAKIREKVKPKIKVGVKLLDIAQFIETEIKNAGAQPAFPVNISINDIAAHYTPIPGDESVFESGDLVKIDFGAHVQGYPSDTAFSVSLGDDQEMVDLAEAALSLAVSLCKPGTPVGEIGAEVQSLIEGKGLKPISNLTGHSMEQWDLHSGISVPNISVPSSIKLEEGQVFAIEPFVSNGSGHVHSASSSQIFMLQSTRVRLPKARRALIFIAENFRTLPFTSRWLPEEFHSVIPYLVTQKALHQYPLLRDIQGCKISQAEHTVLVGDRPEVLT